MDIHGDMHCVTAVQCCPACGRPEVAEREGVVLENRSLSYKGQVISLTYREHQILDLLLRRFKQVVHRDVLWSTVWSDHPDGDLKLIDVYCCKLNRKLRPMGLEIRTSWGVGRSLVFYGSPVANVSRSRYERDEEKERAHAV